ncbi:MAG: flavin reductase family protein [Atopobiaceae bacterium]|nr:flavin reductase family protein [Atopobiaceae bacterium]MBQ6411700.1 flavin reductase family protein [Atopobiaceae bacterium]MBQ6651027.1 flavin reductase family protein [Atopobiaceae bacterium]MBR3384385.1 flavin reductase family protein [Atopobiaceae bacterium]
MRKDLGIKPYVFPMPVLMIATYGEDDVVDVMNMAWGGVCDTDKVALNITESHKTAKNIKARGAFTLSIADLDHIVEADFFGTASGNKYADKFERSGLTATRSELVDAPIIEEFPVTLECEVLELHRCEWGFRVVGKIKNVSAHEEVLDEEGKVDPSKLNALVFDQFQSGYYVVGEKVGQAWNVGRSLL